MASLIVLIYCNASTTHAMYSAAAHKEHCDCVLVQYSQRSMPDLVHYGPRIAHKRVLYFLSEKIGVRRRLRRQSSVNTYNSLGGSKHADFMNSA